MNTFGSRNRAFSRDSQWNSEKAQPTRKEISKRKQGLTISFCKNLCVVVGSKCSMISENSNNEVNLIVE